MRALRICVGGCQTDVRGGSGARGRRVAGRVSCRGRGRAGRARSRALRFVALVGAGARTVDGASLRVRPRSAPARAAVARGRVDRLVRALARRCGARACRSRRSFARRVDRGRVGGGATEPRASARARRPGRHSLRDFPVQSRRAVGRDAVRPEAMVTDGRRRRAARRSAQSAPRRPVRLRARPDRGARVHSRRHAAGVG